MACYSKPSYGLLPGVRQKVRMKAKVPESSQFSEMAWHSLCTFSQVKKVYVYMRMCVCLYVCICMYRCMHHFCTCRGKCQDLPVTPSSFFFCSLISPCARSLLSQLGRLAAELELCLLVSPHFPSACVTSMCGHVWLLRGCWGFKSDACACTTSTLTH